MSNKLKTYTVGYGDDGFWIEGSRNTNNIKEADILIIPGGLDINTELYGEARGKYTGKPSLERDNKEIEAFKYAVEKGMMIVPICRGAQLSCVLSGGKLIQHVTNHSGDHECKTYDSDTILTNSIHHQMMYPWDIPADEYDLISWTESLSTTYLDGNDQEIEFPDIAKINGKIIEPEIVWFKKTRTLAIQWHPEMLWYRNVAESYTLDYVNKLIRLAMEDKEVFTKEKQILI